MDSNNKHKWYEKLFGEKLLKCSNTVEMYDSTENVTKNSNYFGLYFSFANINSKSDDIIEKLKNLYYHLNGGDGDENYDDPMKKFEVIQIVLWVNNDVYNNDSRNSHKECLHGLPWYALPFDEVEIKARLSRKYRIKSGVPTLVLLDKDGSTISISAQDKLSEDPNGINFPWKPRPVDQILNDIVLTTGSAYFKEHHQTKNKREFLYKDLPDGIKGFYFSANWCPPCRAFTPQLIETYKSIRKKDPNFEIIFVSSDRSIESFGTHLECMPWLAVPFQQTSIRSELAQLYGIRGIPTLLLLDTNGHIITTDARTELVEDPTAQNFPWKPRMVNILTDRFAAKLQDFPAIILFVDGEETEVHFAESILKPSAERYYKKFNINFNGYENFDDENYLQFLIGLDNETSDVLRDLIGLDDVIPLLIGLDIPNAKFAVMEYGVELNVENCSEFVEKFQNGELQFININERQ